MKHDVRIQSERCSASRAGITITEVLVTFGLISVLVGLIIPAVMHSRSSAQRVSCSNQLRQLSLAAAQYESTCGGFLGRQFFRQIRTHVEVREDEKYVSLFACPSDRNHANGDQSDGKISYAINDGLGSSKSEHQGMIPQKGRTVRATEVTDGLSNTAMLAERLSRPWYAPQVVAWDERRRDWKRTLLFFRERAATPEEFDAHCEQRAVRPLVSWVLTEQYHHLRAPNSQGCVLVDSRGHYAGGGDFGIGVSAGSPHLGGTFVGFCDGAVKFVSNQIAIDVWRAQGTRSGGEVF
jgi:hypothetical protein